MARTSSCSILYTLFACWLGLCYGFVLISSAAVQNGDLNLFQPGASHIYTWRSMVLLNEKNKTSKNVGFYVEGNAKIETVWGTGVEKVIKIQVDSPQLHVKSRKTPTPAGFVPHTSKLEEYSNHPFFLIWKNGRIQEILLSHDEPVPLRNLKKGIASLLQIRIFDGEFEEIDTSGHCKVTYTSLDPQRILKSKKTCSSSDLDSFSKPKDILGVQVESSRTVEYEIDATGLYLMSVVSKESHQIYERAREELGGHLESEQHLIHLKTEDVKNLIANDINEAIEKSVVSLKVKYNHESLLTEKESVTQEATPLFSKDIEMRRESLNSDLLGSLKPAKSFLYLVKSAKISTKEDIAKALSSKKNKNILPQLYDILGFAQTQESHQAVMKKLHFDNEEQIDLSERYLWALSLSTKPNPDIINDLLNKFNKHTGISEKVKETLILTIASMTRRLSADEQKKNSKLVKKVEETIINNLDYSKGEERFVFFRALRNLHSVSTIPVLINYIKNGTPKQGVLAWKALRTFDPNLWTKELRKLAEETLFQLHKKHDTSSRTLAADIILESNPTDALLVDLLNYVASNDTSFEVAQYVFQSIKMFSDENPDFNNRVQKIIKSSKRLNNYSGLSPRGMSTALKRSFLNNPSSNGSLVSVQEIKSGIVKRGVVNIMLEKGEESKELFGLNIFSGGLSSFVSSNAESEGEEEESATAGMELSVLGTQIRPFVFFNGQGELMGHVWSGTASERTTAFQALIMLQDDLMFIRLGSGFIAEIELNAASSFDLSGKIEISIWNRNSEALVETSAGIYFSGMIKLDTSFVSSQVEFTASIEPKLTLNIDADFSSGVKLCMRLTQPDTTYRQNTFKVEKIPGSKHKIRIAKYKKANIPGTTYALNRKNNEMCSALFSS